MKKLIIFSCLFLVASIGFSQSNTRLQGPKAKNHKPWMNKNKTSSIVYVENKKPLKGPKAKNAKPWHQKKEGEYLQIVATGNRSFLKGPRAKNAKYWSYTSVKNRNNIVNTDSMHTKIITEK
ncbi:MAG: hypothetical protein AB8G86_06600 [Saprospiraceae bacterium]